MIINPYQIDFRSLDDRTLKSIAFSYHYGSWIDVYVATHSISGLAAAEQARRRKHMLHRPHLIGDPVMTPEENRVFVQDFVRKASARVRDKG